MSESDSCLGPEGVKNGFLQAALVVILRLDTQELWQTFPYKVREQRGYPEVFCQPWTGRFQWRVGALVPFDMKPGEIAKIAASWKARLTVAVDGRRMYECNRPLYLYAPIHHVRLPESLREMERMPEWKDGYAGHQIRLDVFYEPIPGRSEV